MPDSSLRAVFKKPAQEVVAYFAAKRAQPSEGWETVSAAEHQRAFTVAQTAGFNVLGDMQEALQRARDEGWSRAKFTEHLEPLLRAKGWWGKAIDPATGEILQHYPGSSKPVEYGSPARLRLVHDSNVVDQLRRGALSAPASQQGRFAVFALYRAAGYAHAQDACRTQRSSVAGRASDYCAHLSAQWLPLPLHDAGAARRRCARGHAQ